MENRSPAILGAVVACWFSLGLACGPVSAALELDFVTSRGTVTVVMEYEKAPMAVANLIGLIGGNRSFVDPASGLVKRSRFLEGASFARVENSASAKLAEVSHAGWADGWGPGYSFPDEWDASLPHEPYVLSMANHGPNTNGATICFTGGLAMPARDGLHTVFGRITSAAGRAVVDAILSAGAGGTTVVSVAIRSTDPSAASFDPASVVLPEAVAVSSPLVVRPGVSVHWAGGQPGSSVLQAHGSSDLVSWEPWFRNMVGLDDAPPADPQFIDDASRDAFFYAFSLVRYADVTGVSTLAGRELSIESPGIGTITYRFNPAGNGGTYENVVFPGEPPFFSGPFEVLVSNPPVFEPYAFEVLLKADGLGGAPFNRVRAGCDAAEPSAITGRHRTLFLSSAMSPLFEESGNLILTR